MHGTPAAPEIALADVVQLRKPHPCGANRWCVVRVGADVGLRCLGCQRRVLLSRREFSRRLKAVIARAADPAAPVAAVPER